MHALMYFHAAQRVLDARMHLHMRVPACRLGECRNRQGQCTGCHRVWLPHANYPGLAMSRCVGLSGAAKREKVSRVV